MQRKSYGSSCPIARGLDHIGDRWTLLLLRDLHAGPARFVDLASGLPGMASNLLTNRLEALQDSGLIEQRAGASGPTVYALTPLGASTAPVLEALLTFGAQYPTPDALRAPGHLRALCLPLSSVFSGVLDAGEHMTIELRIDDEAFALVVDGPTASVRHGHAEDALAIVGVPRALAERAIDGTLEPGDVSLERFELIGGALEHIPRVLSVLNAAFSRALSASL